MPIYTSLEILSPLNHDTVFYYTKQYFIIIKQAFQKVKLKDSFNIF